MRRARGASTARGAVNLYRRAAEAYERADVPEKVADALTVLVGSIKDTEARAR